MGASDFTDNGHLDLLWRHQVAGLTVLWEMEGLAIQNTRSLPSVGPGWTAVV
jgi:hypothetical protein